MTVVPVLIYFAIPESPRWLLRRGQPQAAADIVNRIIRRAGSTVQPLTVAALGDNLPTARERLPPYWALFGRGQLRWTTVGILSGVCAGTAGFLIHVLLPKALVDQGTAVTFSFGLSSLVYFASIPGKGFTGFLMEIIGRRWTIAYALAGSLPGLFLMLIAHLAGQYATVVMVAGALITGFTVLSAFTATRVYLSEQFPTALRGRGQPFGESFGRLFAGVLAPFLMVPHTGSPTIFFGTIFVVVAIGAFIPLALWPRDRRPARNGDRGRTRVGLTRRREPVIDLLRALSRVGERNSAEIARAAHWLDALSRAHHRRRDLFVVPELPLSETKCPTPLFAERTDDDTRSISATRPFVSRFMPAMRPSRFSSRRISRRSRRNVGASPFSTFPAICLAKPPPQRRDAGDPPSILGVTSDVGTMADSRSGTGRSRF